MKKPKEGKLTAAVGMRSAETQAFNRQHYGALIRDRRTRLELSQAQLAQRLGVQKAYVTHWEAGRSRPDLNLIPSLCKELGISLAAFFNEPATQDSLSPAEQRHMEMYRRVTERDRTILDAVLSKMEEMATTELWDRCRRGFRLIYRNDQHAAACSGLMLENEVTGEPVFVRDTPVSRRADELVTVSGASMEPDFRSGESVYIEHTPSLSVGETGLFIINGEGFIKQYQGDHLHSLNPQYKDIPLSEFDEIRIVGRVLGTVQEGDYPTQQELTVLEELQRENR